ncbi:MAG: ATPase, T2SS/T4P/T4SS family, partial [Pseudomonadales bacterium]
MSPAQETFDAITAELIELKVITERVVSSLRTPESVEEIPQVLSDYIDEDSIAIAIASSTNHEYKEHKYIDVRMVRFASKDNRDCAWIIEGSTLFTTNPFAAAEHQRIYDKHIDIIGTLGVISASVFESNIWNELESINNKYDPMDDREQENEARNLLSGFLLDAYRYKASDIHFIILNNDKVDVRLRIDGGLRPYKTYPLSMHNSLCHVLIEHKDYCDRPYQKIMPEDLDASFKPSSNKEVRLRVATVPVKIGTQKVTDITIRLLNSDNNLTLATLGLSNENMNKIQSYASKPHGIVLVTGPTGSGKSTTLFAVLKNLQSLCPDNSFFTLEDPVEQQMPGFRHIECRKPEEGNTNILTYAIGLKSLLRKDPDKILIGEIRDDEVAGLAFEASMTGHLVFSTLHTNNAHMAIDRLLDKGIDRSMLAESLKGITGQRLVRTLCNQCKKKQSFASCGNYYSKYGNDPFFTESKMSFFYEA